MNTILIMIATTAIFFIGIQVGYNLKEGKKIIDSPEIQKEEEKKQSDMESTEETTEQNNREEIERLNKIMRNLDNFNGTEEGQVNID